MRVIPVIDLQGGGVVRGVAGERSHYRPVTSVLAADPQPRTVAQAFVERLEADEVYVADLDAIAGAGPNWEALAGIAETGLAMVVDAGIRDRGRARDMAHYACSESRLSGIVVGLESVTGPEDLADLASELEPERRVFSLDLRHGQPLTVSPVWQSLSAEEIAGFAVAAGFRRLIVLDLAFVGVNRGLGVEPLCHSLRTVFPDIELIAGGGVRGVDDLRRLADCGCNAALVASALHDGRLTAEDLRAIS
jgi:phosphoribosylformimino-5-aminoimidazole carboxamide ribotide isomerase